MVKLPEENAPDHSLWRIRQWLYRCNQLDKDDIIKPLSLLELEEFADLADSFTKIMRNTASAQRFRQITINRIRELFRMEFKLLCDECGTAHYQDEVTAPER